VSKPIDILTLADCLTSTFAPDEARMAAAAAMPHCGMPTVI
jgi:hypothetical protein